MSETDIADIGLGHNLAPLELAPGERRRLRAEAHHLHPVVSVGQQGLTPAVLHEIDVALAAHGLVKVRVFNDDREAREALLGEVCAQAGCAPVQHLGKLLILWRPLPKAEAATKPSRKALPAKDSRAARTPRAAKTSRAGKAPASRGGPAAKKAVAGKGAKPPGGKRGPAASRGSRDDEASRKPKMPRRARGQPQSAFDDAQRPPRSPKSPRTPSHSPKAPRGKGRTAAPSPTSGAGAGKSTRVPPTAAPRASGRRTAGGPVGVPRAPNPRRRRTQSR
jgi:RNA-binding protein